MKWITKCFKNYAVFNGRAGRNECTYFFLFVTFVQVFFLTIDLLIGWKFQNIIDGIPWYPLFEISRLLTALPAFAVGVRRLHDLNKSGWWILLIFTGIGKFYILCARGYKLEIILNLYDFGEDGCNLVH